MKYLISILLLFTSCNTYYNLYDEPVLVDDIIYHGVHCEDTIKSFSMVVRTKDTTYPKQHVKGNNIPYEYRVWIYENEICLDGCKILMKDVTYTNNNNKDNFVIDVLGYDME